MPMRNLGEFGGGGKVPRPVCQRADAGYTTLNDFVSFGRMITENPLFRGSFGISIIRDFVKVPCRAEERCACRGRMD